MSSSKKISLRLYRFLLFLLCLLLLPASLLPAFTSKGQTDYETLFASSSPRQELSLYSQAAVLMDGDSGRILYAKNPQQILPMASTTKVMTCLLALENAQLSDTVEVSSYAASMPDVQLNMQKGETFRMEDLLYSLMLASHNDTAVAVAEHIGSALLAEESINLPPASVRTQEESREAVARFASLMNQRALVMGCKDTHFVTPNGLDAQDEAGIHSTTAADLALIMREAIQNETFLSITQTPSRSFSDLEGKRSYSVTNKNALLTMYQGALSGKTGFTGNAGYCYTGAAESEGRTFIVALLACGWPPYKNRKWTDARTLLSYGMENYHYRNVWQEPTLPRIQVHNGIRNNNVFDEADSIPLVLSHVPKELSLLLSEEEEPDFIYEVPDYLEAPFQAGIQAGSLHCVLDGMTMASYPLYTGETITTRSFSGYLTQTLKTWAGEIPLFGENPGR